MKTNNLIEVLTGKHFQLGSDDVIIKKRVKGLSKKPPLYTWNLTRACYVSSLKQSGDTFYFDLRKGEDLENYSLKLAENGQVEVQKLA